MANLLRIFDLGLRLLDPDNVPRFTAFYEATDLARLVPLKNVADARLPLDEECIAALGIPYR
jgi:hypothetical protein